ncbi:MAG: hypothetical protein HDR27_00015 [Lachnospiraceae bacterium]|nr:hypothetical protein [Lachnospiraceae bacterium]
MEQEIITILSEINPYVEISVESKLLEEQILDSLGILVLISELEAKYSVQIPLDTIRREDFETVLSIVKLVNGLR